MTDKTKVFPEPIGPHHSENIDTVTNAVISICQQNYAEHKQMSDCLNEIQTQIQSRDVVSDHEGNSELKATLKNVEYANSKGVFDELNFVSWGLRYLFGLGVALIVISAALIGFGLSTFQVLSIGLIGLALVGIYFVVRSSAKLPERMQELQDRLQISVILDQFKRVEKSTTQGKEEHADQEWRAVLTNELSKRDKADLILGREITGRVLDSLKIALLDTSNQIQAGFRLTALMYNVAFYTGIALLFASVLFAWFPPTASSNPAMPAIFAAAGIADVMTFLITKPPRDLQKSRGQLAQLQAAFYTWLNDNKTWQNYLTNSLNHKKDVIEFLKSKREHLQNTQIDEIQDLVERQYAYDVVVDSQVYNTASEKFLNNAERMVRVISSCVDGDATNVNEVGNAASSLEALISLQKTDSQLVSDDDIKTFKEYFNNVKKQSESLLSQVSSTK